jgi:hypothetical protein
MRWRSYDLKGPLPRSTTRALEVAIYGLPAHTPWPALDDGLLKVAAGHFVFVSKREVQCQGAQVATNPREALEPTRPCRSR